MIYAENFTPKEFREWSEDMSPRLITLLDVLRFQIGSPIVISPNPDSLGRRQGASKESAHNIDKWGQVLAADFFIPHVTTRAACEDVVHTMGKLGFTGIGFYPTTELYGKPLPMFHGDVRPNRDMGSPATWGRIGEKWTSLIAAIQHLER